MSRYSYVASRASTARPKTSPPPRATASLRSLYGSGGTSKSWARPWRSSTSTRSTFRPPSARASASAAATVVLPVPPFPVTTCRRTPSQSLTIYESRRRYADGRSKIGEQADRPLDAVRDEAEEPASRCAVAHPVVERQRQLCDLADSQFSVDDPGLVDDPTDPQQRGLGVVDDRSGAVDAEDPVVVERDAAAGEVVGLELAVAGEGGEATELFGKLERALVVCVPDDGNDEPAFGLGREAEIDVRELDDLLAVHAGVELGVTTEPGHHEAGQQSQHTDGDVRIGTAERVARLDESGRVDVDPGRDIGDLATAAGHFVGHSSPDATQWDPDLPVLALIDGSADGGLDVTTEHDAGWARSAQPGHVETPVAGEPAHHRGDHARRRLVPIGHPDVCGRGSGHGLRGGCVCRSSTRASGTAARAVADQDGARAGSLLVVMGLGGTGRGVSRRLDAHQRLSHRYH